METIDLNTATKTEMLSFLSSEPSLAQWINIEQTEADMRERFEMWLRLNSISL